MNKQKVVQKRLWSEKEFSLEDGILRLREIGLFGGVELEVRYEDIISEKKLRRTPNYFLLTAATVLMSLSVVNLFGNATIGSQSLIPWWGIIMAGSLYYLAYKSAQEVLYFNTIYDTEIAFFRNKNQQIATDDFVNEFLEQRKVFLVEKYWDCADSLEQKMQNLDWLKNCNVVNLDEFKYLREETLNHYTAYKTPIGFKVQTA